MSSYLPEQKKMLIKYLSEHKDNSLTIEEITEGIARTVDNKESAPGQSTVYRLVNKLLTEGKVKKFVKEGTRKAAYQLVEGAHCATHLHLKCTDCGRLFHMREQLSEELIMKIGADQGFFVSRAETVLYGKCRACGQK